MAFDYEKFCDHRYDLSVDNPPDLGVVGGNPGVGANIVGHPNGIGGGRCAEYNGNNSNMNLGDVVMLNAVSKFTIVFCMRQRVLDVTDAIFDKGGWGVAESGILISTSGGGQMYLQIDGANQRGYFDYSLVVSVNQWHHIAIVFNGAGIGNTGRLQCYVGGTPVTLTYDGTIPAATDDLSGIDATIGRGAASFDGRLDDFRFYSVPCTNLDVSDLMARSRRGAMGG